VRFLVDPTPARLARSRAPVRAFLAFAALAVAALLLQRGVSVGFTAAAVEGHYLGGGQDPMPAAALLEELHAGAFTYGLMLFMVGALLAVSRVRPGVRTALFAAAVTASLLDLAAPFLVVALRGAGGLRVATTVAAALTLGAAIGVAFATFARPAPVPRPEGAHG